MFRYTRRPPATHEYTLLSSDSHYAYASKKNRPRRLFVGLSYIFTPFTRSFASHRLLTETSPYSSYCPPKTAMSLFSSFSFRYSYTVNVTA
jgi:hypothetical protein